MKLGHHLLATKIFCCQLGSQSSSVNEYFFSNLSHICPKGTFLIDLVLYFNVALG